MRRLTQQEFEDRTLALMRSQKIFIDSNITNNISEAFLLYQEVLAETERPLTLTTSKNQKQQGSPKKYHTWERMVPHIQTTKIEKMICKTCGQPTVTVDDLCPGCPSYAEGNRYSFYCSSCHLTTFGVTING